MCVVELVLGLVGLLGWLSFILRVSFYSNAGGFACRQEAALARACAVKGASPHPIGPRLLPPPPILPLPTTLLPLPPSPRHSYVRLLALSPLSSSRATWRLSLFSCVLSLSLSLSLSLALSLPPVAPCPLSLSRSLSHSLFISITCCVWFLLSRAHVFSAIGGATALRCGSAVCVVGNGRDGGGGAALCSCVWRSWCWRLRVCWLGWEIGTRTP